MCLSRGCESNHGFTLLCVGNFSTSCVAIFQPFFGWFFQLFFFLLKGMQFPNQYVLEISHYVWRNFSISLWYLSNFFIGNFLNFFSEMTAATMTDLWWRSPPEKLTEMGRKRWNQKIGIWNFQIGLGLLIGDLFSWVNLGI